MKLLKVRLKKSIIGKNKNHKRIIKALGLRRINQEVFHKPTPSILGMIEKVKYMIEVEEVER